MPVHAAAHVPILTSGYVVSPGAAALIPGTSAIVRGDGDCLRLRAQPSLNGERIICLPDGSIVLVLEGTVEADGFRWQHVQAGALVGWAAAEFLAPEPRGPACATSGAAALSFQPGLTGTLPAGGGFGLVLWGGGTAHGVANAAASADCNLRSLWATRPDGGFVGYIYGAPDFVNTAWLELFPGGRIPAGTPLLALCNGTSSGLAIAVAREGVPPPAPRAAAPTLAGATAPTVDAAAAVVIDGNSGAVLFDQDARRQLAPASLTKIASAILAIEGSDLDGWAESNVDSRAMPDSSVMGLQPGDCFLVRDLLYGLMLPSGNDAALAIGRHVAGSDGAFVAGMNTLMERLGLQDTHFKNPHGLDASGHVSSAYDIAMLARYGMTLPDFAQAVAAPAWTAFGSRQLVMLNGNYFLSSYPDADGVKTGFTEGAGRTLAASAIRDGQRLYVVLLDAPNRFTDAAELFDWAFANHVWSGH